jgi:von Willebrand factor type A domain
MRKAILSLCTVLLVLLQGLQKAQADENFALVVIAADQSESMFDTNHVDIMREAVITALSNYVVDCNNLQVDYIAWGASVEEPVSMRLTDQEAIDDYMLALWPESHKILNTTDHSLGISASVSQFTASKADKKVLIFVTDGVSNETRNFNLEQIIPADVIVYTISLGPADVSTFVVDNIQPATGGVHFHANNTDQFIGSLERAFAAAKTDLCLS